MSLFDGLTKVTNTNIPYAPCGKQCKKCRPGKCTKHDGHTSGLTTDGGHYSARGWNEALQIEGCGHQW